MLSEDLLAPFFIHGCVLRQTVIEPIALARWDPPRVNRLRCFTVGMTQASFFPHSPNNQEEGSSDESNELTSVFCSPIPPHFAQYQTVSDDL